MINKSIKFPFPHRYISRGWFHHYWCEDNNFDLSNHVYEWDGVVHTKDNLPDVVNTILKSPFDSHRSKHSPWEQALVHFTDGELLLYSFILFKGGIMVSLAY